MVSKQLGLAVVIVLLSLAIFTATAHAFDAPTNAKFEVTSTGNVNTHTGDMSLSIPLMTVPGVGGTDFPIALSYGSGIKLDQQSGSVGLGWSLGIPTISRNVVGVPDDYYPEVGVQNNKNLFYYDKITTQGQYYEEQKKSHKDSFGVGLSIAGFVGSLALAPFTGGLSLGIQGIWAGSFYAGNIGLAASAGVGAVQSARSIYQQSHGYSTTEMVARLYQVAKQPKILGSYGFYWLPQIGGLDEQENEIRVLDYNSPDIFTVNSPVYSGQLTYGIKNPAGQNTPYIFHAAVAKGNVEDILTSDENNCGNGDTLNPESCVDALQIKVTEESGTVKRFNRFEITDVSGNLYVFEPVGKMDGTATTFSTGTMEDLNYSLTQNFQTKLGKFASYYRTTVRPNTCIGWTCYHDNTGCQFGVDGDYQERAFLDPYYIEWGITEIKSVHEKNIVGEGDWSVKFDWDYWNNGGGYSNEWGPLFEKRNPDQVYVGGQYYNMYCLEKPDGSMAWSESFSNAKVLRAIRTKTHTATFIYEDKEDGRESASGQYSGPAGSNNNKQKKLVRIELRNNNDPQHEILQQVKFDYDYGFFTFGLPNNEPGRLRLKSVQICGKNNECQPPIQFEYYTDGSQVYIPWLFDRWGDYFVGGSKYHHNSEGDNQYDNLYISPELYSLSRVTWPTGGTTEYVYESDRYINVNNFYADPAPSMGIEKTDTHYGGGARVKLVRNCDGLSGPTACHSTRYIYVQDINTYDFGSGEKDGHTVSGIGGESSGVAISEPGSYDGKDDSLIPTMGNAFSQQYVSYSKVYEIPGYNEQATTLQAAAPYGYKKYEYITSATTSTEQDNKYKYADQGYYEPAQLFEHPLQEGFWYGFSFPKSKPIANIKEAVGFTIIPIKKPVLVFGPPGHKLRFIFKIGYDRNHDDDKERYGNRYMYVDVELPSAANSLCNTQLSSDTSKILSCKSVNFQEGTVAARNHEDNQDIGKAMCSDIYKDGCLESNLFLRGVMYDITENDQNYNPDGGGMKDNGFTPEMVSSPVIKFVWAQDAEIKCNNQGISGSDDDVDGCHCTGSDDWTIYNANYRMDNNWVTENGGSLAGFSFFQGGDGLSSCTSTYQHPEFNYLQCPDRDSDNVCDWVDNNFITTTEMPVRYRYASSLTHDYLRGSLISEESYNANGKLISYSYPEFENRLLSAQNDIYGDLLRLPSIWSIKTKDTTMQDDTVTETTYTPNVVNGLISKSEAVNSDNKKIIVVNKYAFASDMSGGDNLIGTHEWDKIYETRTYQDLENPDNMVSSSLTVWKELVDQQTSSTPGGHVIDYQKSWLKSVDQYVQTTKYLEYDKYARPYHTATSNSYDQNGNPITITHSYSWFGDSGNECLDVSLNNPYGVNYQNGGGYGNAYLTCTQTCSQTDNTQDGYVDNICVNGGDPSKLITAKAYYNKIGEIIEIKDSNNQRSQFVYDDMWRLEEVYQPSLIPQQTELSKTYSYVYALDDGNGLSYPDDMNKVTTTTKITDIISSEATGYFDGSARDRLVKTIDTDNNVIMTETQYNSMGLTDQVSNPYKSGEQVVWTKTIYEKSPLARVDKVYPLGEYGGNGYFVQSTYNGEQNYHTTAVIDEKGGGAATIDKLGRTVEANENNIAINPSFELGEVGSEPELWNCEDAGQYKLVNGGKYGAKALRQNVPGYKCLGKERIPIQSYTEDFTICGDFKKTSGTADSYLGIQGYDENGNEINHCFAYPSIVTPTTSWQRYCGSTRLSSDEHCINAKYVSIKLFNNYQGTSTTVLSDGIQIYKGTDSPESDKFISTKTYYYDAFGLHTKVTNANNQETETVSDSLGRVRVVQNPDFGVRRNLKYDARGNVLVSGDGCDWGNGAYSDTNPNSHNCQRKTGFVYDALNRLYCVNYEIPSANAWTGVSADCDISAKYTKNYYDTYTGTDCDDEDGFNYPNGRLVKVVDTYNKAQPYSACYYYDTRGQMRKEIRSFDGSSYTIYYDYDNARNMIKMTYPNANNDFAHYDYDSLGQLRGVYLNNKVYNPGFEYADIGAIDLTKFEDLRMGWPFNRGGCGSAYTTTEISSDKYQGDKSLHFRSVTGGCGVYQTLDNIEDGDYIVAYIKTPVGSSGRIKMGMCSSSYFDIINPTNGQWMLFSKQKAGPCPDPQLYFYSYDNTPTEVYIDSVQVTKNPANEFVGSTYSYESDGMLKQKIYGNNVKTSYEYTQRNWISQIDTTGMHKIISGQPRNAEIKETYEYDDVGNLMFLDDYDITTLYNVHTRTGFTYDNLYRLTSAYKVDLPGFGDSDTGRYWQNLQYSYDDVGNMLTQNLINYDIATGKNQIQKIKNPGYNAQDDIFKTAYTYDNYGNVKTQEGWQEISFALTTTGEEESPDITDYWIYNVDANVGDTVRVVYYAIGLEPPPAGQVYMWEAPVEQYTGSNPPNGRTYRNIVRINPNRVVSSMGPSSVDWYSPNHIDYYFHVYLDKKINYCFDYTNRLQHWWETVNSQVRDCMAFEYDPSGIRIKKTEMREWGSALKLDGVDDYVNLGNVNILNQIIMPFTIEAWVKAPSDSIEEPIFASDNKPDGASTHGLDLVVYGADEKVSIRIRDGSNYKMWKTSTGITPNTWTHIAAVVTSASNMKIYINGIDAGGTASGTATTLAHNSNPAEIGRRYIDQLRYADGSIDEVRIWLRALGSTEINENMNKELTGTENGLIGYWKFNENAGTSALDSALDSDGTLINGAGWAEDHYGKIAYVTRYVTQGNNVIYEENEIDSGFTCPSSCTYWQGQQLLQPPSQEISSVQQKTTTSSASNNLNTIIQKAGAAIGNFMLPFLR